MRVACSDFMDVGKPPITKHFTVSPVVFLLTAEVFFLVFVSSYGVLVRVSREAKRTHKKQRCRFQLLGFHRPPSNLYLASRGACMLFYHCCRLAGTDSMRLVFITPQTTEQISFLR